MRHFPLLSLLIVGAQIHPALAQSGAKTKPSAKPAAKPRPRPKSGSQPQPSPKPSAAQERAADAAFKAGGALIAEEKYPEALAQFQKALQIFPDDPSILWNAASAAFTSRQYPLAAAYFERDAKYEPLNGQLYARLVQTYQALGDTTRRDANRAKVFAMHRSGKDESGYTQKASYCRDQFTVNGLQVFAFEFFELKPNANKNNPFSKRYEFLVARPGAETATMRLEVGWSYLEFDSKGGFQPTKGMSTFYFDAYYPEGLYSRKTFGLFSSELPYDTVKQRLIDILNDKVEIISSQTRPPKGPSAE